MAPASFLAKLETAADAAGAAESAYRRESAERIRTLERDRSFAFRRLNLMKGLAEASARSESEEMAVANGLALLQAKLEPSQDSERRAEMLSRFAAVSRAVYLEGRADADPGTQDALAALAGFEAWYAEAHGMHFWELFEQPILETPLVDF